MTQVSQIRHPSAALSARYPDMLRVLEADPVLHSIYRIPRARIWRYLLSLDWWRDDGSERDGPTLAEIVQRHGCRWDWEFSSICGTAKFQTLEAAEAALAEAERRWPAVDSAFRQKQLRRTA